MKNNRYFIKTLTICAFCMTMFVLSGCQLFNKNEPSTLTSVDAGLYVASDGVVDEKGQINSEYGFDQNKNIVKKKDGEVVVFAENASSFIYTTSIQPLMSVSSLNISLHYSSAEKEFLTQPVQFRVNINPTAPTYPYVIFTSLNPELLELDETPVKMVDGVAEIYGVCKKAGTANIVVVSGDLKQTYNFYVTIVNDDVAVVEEEKTDEESAEATPTPEASVSPVEEIKDEDILPTTKDEKGWIKGVNVNFRKQPNTSSEIIYTYGNGKQITVLSDVMSGWIKCSIDNKIGYIKAAYVVDKDPLAEEKAEETQKKTEDSGLMSGYQNEQEIEKKTTENHVHYYKPVSENGKIVYKCDCGLSYTNR